jgi:hypothetical protein
MFGLAKGPPARPRTRWQYEPPSLIWSKVEAFEWQPTGVPEPDKVWFCPWEGAPPPWWSQFEDDAAQVISADMHALLIDFLALPERVHDAINDPAGYAAKWSHLF